MGQIISLFGVRIDGLGLGLGLVSNGLGLGLGLASAGLGIGLESYGLGLGLGLATAGLDYISGNLSSARLYFTECSHIPNFKFLSSAIPEIGRESENKKKWSHDLGHAPFDDNLSLAGYYATYTIHTQNFMFLASPVLEIGAKTAPGARPRPLWR